MGMLTDRMVCNLEDHVVEVEAGSKLLGFEYSLIIDNKRVDVCSGFLGMRTLRGFVGEKPVVVTVKQGLLGTKYALNIGGQEHTFQKLQ